MRPLKLYWCARLVRGRKNFGDWISPELCRALSGREVEYASANSADLVAVGSILSRVKTHFWNRRVDVWGSGLMSQKKTGRPIHRYHAVRGALTQELVGAQSVSALGDPGLLVDLLFPKFADVPKRWDIGLVPHHIDQSHPSVKAFTSKIPGARVLDILSGTQEFLSELAACRFVLSSSLHGLVAADAFGIPNTRVTITDELRGGGFKFRDYYSAFGMEMPETRVLGRVDENFIEQARQNYSRPRLKEIKQSLLRAFPFPR
jgi:pyruvyltransferase